ncbi:MAG: divergent polysaccharide deacetylase family protein [Gammaproteobacteria bacterium]|nr:divergent polysaccharide deacetylase family protein [Gammaproteobacteria bacterium]
MPSLLLLLFIGLLPVSGFCADEEDSNSSPRISIIIDDMGNRLRDGSKAIALPGKLTYAFLPHTPFSKRLAAVAHDEGKEVMLHQPMEAITGNHLLGEGGITLDMTQKAIEQTLRRNLASVPYSVGINNHMGSLMTRHPGNMAWLMKILKRRGGLYFVDSQTTSKSIARQIAKEHEVPSARRNIFLDHTVDPDVIKEQFTRLIQQAKLVGSAIGIGHPHPETIAVLKEMLPELEQHNIKLIPVSEMIQYQKVWSPIVWQASLSPSRPDSKN